MKTTTQLAKEFAEEKKSSELIYNGKVFRIFRDTVSLPDGKDALREVARHIGAVCVVPVTNDGKVVMVRQYRYAVGKVLWEIPAGKLDRPDENPLEAAARELREETGAVAAKMQYLGEYLGSPAILDEKIQMYLAIDLTFGETSPDEDEFVQPDTVDLMTLVEMVMAGEIPDGKTQVAILRAAAMLGFVSHAKQPFTEK